MPAYLIFHKRHAFALYGFGEDRRGLALYGLCLVKRGLDLLKVVSVDLDHLKAECLKLFVKRFDSRHVLNSAVDLQTVLVNDHNEVVELVVRSKHCRLPNLAFLYLAVAENCICAIVFVVKLCRERHSARRRYALSERACAHINAGCTLHIRVTLEHSADMAEHRELLPVKKSLERQNGVKAGAAVTL